MIYRIDPDFYHPIHHVRPRFKADLEGVLFYFSSKIASIQECPKAEFRKVLNGFIRDYNGNSSLSFKTVDNWRTEISALFSFIQYSEDRTDCRPSRRAVELANDQDLVSFFKKFITTFEYPGYHIKPHEFEILYDLGVKFKPLYYILELLLSMKKLQEAEKYVTKEEIAHMVFNDLRSTTGKRSPLESLKIIVSNRKHKTTYVTKGDVTRYAADFLDYMHYANVLIKVKNKYILNLNEKSFIEYVLKNKFYFNDLVTSLPKKERESTNSLQNLWIDYVNTEFLQDVYDTDLDTYIESNRVESQAIEEGPATIKFRNSGAKEIGDLGEEIVLKFEKEKLASAQLDHLVAGVKKIPDVYGAGYDIDSFRIDDESRIYIEVKTTVSIKMLDFEQFTLRSYQWKAAERYKDDYYIYRLVVSKFSKKLYIIKNPVDLYKTNKLFIIPEKGVSVIVSPTIPEVKIYDIQ